MLATFNLSFHNHLMVPQEDAIKGCRFKIKGTCLELMAGCGRNNKLLRKYFFKVEMLERNLSMVEDIKKCTPLPDKVHHQDVRDFDWVQRADKY